MTVADGFGAWKGGLLGAGQGAAAVSKMEDLAAHARIPASGSRAGDFPIPSRDAFRQNVKPVPRVELRANV